MCQIYVGADPALYRSRARSMRLHGMVTSIRLENQFWVILDRMALAERKSTTRLITTLHDELLAHRGQVENFASFLRVCCVRFEEARVSALDERAADTPPLKRSA
ncbi:MAG TPA: ribbon-helix-helix domain-containing protein [Casimicrobiaceae bacterium]